MSLDAGWCSGEISDEQQGAEPESLDQRQLADYLRGLQVQLEVPGFEAQQFRAELAAGRLLIRPLLEPRPDGFQRQGIVGESEVLLNCLESATRVAHSGAAVTISGETGTGKELFARAIHNSGTRQQEAFVLVDCCSLLEEEAVELLCGPATAGGSRAGSGLLQQASGGTLFLDEVAELPLPAQQSLEDQLQVGIRAEKAPADLQLIAATNRNLNSLAAQGAFNPALAERLGQVLIELPPLRERLADLELLIDDQLQRLCERYQLPRKKYAQGFLQTLQAYHWPGNVRELANTLEQALCAARREQTLFAKHLPTHLRVQVMKSQLRSRNSGKTSPSLQ